VTKPTTEEGTTVSIHTTRARRFFARAHRIWQELDYAQRRSLDMRVGVPSPRLARPTVHDEHGKDVA
jgi:hypothetical protein